MGMYDKGILDPQTGVLGTLTDQVNGKRLLLAVLSIVPSAYLLREGRSVELCFLTSHVAFVEQ